MKTTTDNERETEHRIAGDMIYLCGCAVNGYVPDTARVSEMDLSALFRLANQHMLAAAAAFRVLLQTLRVAEGSSLLHPNKPTCRI